MTLFVESGCPFWLRAQEILYGSQTNAQVWNVGEADGLAEFYALSPDSDEMPLLVTDAGEQFNGLAAVDELRRMVSGE